MKKLFLSFTFMLSVTALAKTSETSSLSARAQAESNRQIPISLQYLTFSDFADNRNPRAYTHSFTAGAEYGLGSNFSISAELGLRAETIGGQIEKGAEQTYDEVISPSTEFAISYDRHFLTNHSFGADLHGEPLWDQASRLEGYKGVIGADGRAILRFWDRRYAMGLNLDLSSLINTYPDRADNSPNPDYFYTMKWSHSFAIWSSLKFSYTFGAKVTRYLDGFIGYSYSEKYGLAYSWQRLTVAGIYTNGGFTDDGEVSLWFVDKYRRIGMLVVSYAF